MFVDYQIFAGLLERHFVRNWLVALECIKTVRCFDIRSGRTFVGKDDPRNPRTFIAQDDDSTVTYNFCTYERFSIVYFFFSHILSKAYLKYPLRLGVSSN